MLLEYAGSCGHGKLQSKPGELPLEMMLDVVHRWGVVVYAALVVDTLGKGEKKVDPRATHKFYLSVMGEVVGKVGETTVVIGEKVMEVQVVCPDDEHALRMGENFVMGLCDGCLPLMMREAHYSKDKSMWNRRMDRLIEVGIIRENSNRLDGRER